MEHAVQQPIKTPEASFLTVGVEQAWGGPTSRQLQRMRDLVRVGFSAGLEGTAAVTSEGMTDSGKMLMWFGLPKVWFGVEGAFINARVWRGSRCVYNRQEQLVP